MGKRFALYALGAFALLVLVQAVHAPMAAASPGWWNDNWAWQRSITITAGETVPENYQENVLLPYCPDMAFENFQDSRLVWENSTGEYTLPYWFESVNPGMSAKVWVKLPVALSAGQAYDNLKWYYGNPAAAPAENGEGVFLLFDNFDTWDNVNKWAEIDSDDWYVSYDATNKWLEGNTGTDGGYAYGIYSRDDFTRPFVFELDTYFTGDDATFFGIKNNTDTLSSAQFEHAVATRGENRYLRWTKPLNPVTPTGLTYTTDTWRRWGFIARPSSGGVFDNDLSNGWGDNYTNTNGALTSFKVALATSDAYWRIDNVRVRKFVGSPPTATIGEAQPVHEWITVESWSGTVSAPAVTGWSAVESWSGTVSTATASWASVETWIGTASAPVPAPILLSPADGTNTTNTTPTFDWDNFLPADNFQIQVGNDADFLSPTFEAENTGSQYTPATALADGLYYWRVCAFRNNESSTWSENRAFRVDTVKPAQSALITPTNENDNTPLLDWIAPPENSYPLLYRVFVSHFQSFSDTVFLTDWLTEDNWAFPSSLADNLYYWRVMAKDNAGNTGDWTDPRALRVDTLPPSAPALVSPSNGGWGGITTNLSWDSPPENSTPVLYHVEISDSPDFSTSLQSSGWIANNNWATPSLSNTTWYWHVRAKDSVGNTGNISDNRVFVVDAAGPSQVQLSTPLDGETYTTTSSVTFLWQNAEDNQSGVGGYEIQVGGSTTSVSSNTFTSAYSNGTYSWRVRAVDMVGNYGGWSGARSFTINVQQQQQPSGGGSPPQDTTPPTLELIEPTTGSVGENVTVLFKVTDSSGINSGSISVTLDNKPAQYTLAGDTVRSAFTWLNAGAHVVKITAKDASSNHNEASATVSFTVEQKTTAATVALAVGTGENRIATFDSDNLPLKKVTISHNENIGENSTLGSMVVSARLVEGFLVLSPENVKVYACLEISVTTPESALTSAIINFVVPRTWLMANNLGSSEVALYHMEGGVWVELQTTKVGEDNAFVYYSALAHSFSPFVIGVKIVSPTFSLILPSTPLLVEEGYVQVTVWVSNPTSSQIQKRLELRLGGNSRWVDVAALPGGVSQIAVRMHVEGALPGPCDVWLYDPSENTLLDSGSVTLSSAVDQPRATVPMVPPQLPTYLIVAGGASGVIAALGALRFFGRLPTPHMPRHRLRGRLVGERRPRAQVKVDSPVLQMYEELLVPAAREIFEESPIVQDYCNLLLPAALEASTREKVEHIGRAVKPHKSRR